MSNEEHIEEMYYNAYQSGVINKFRKKIQKRKNKNTEKSHLDIIEEVYFKMIKKNLIKEIGLSKL
jgi:hypothetical protein